MAATKNVAEEERVISLNSASKNFNDRLLVAAVIGVAVSMAITSGIVNPIAKSVEFARAIAAGNLKRFARNLPGR